MAAGFYGEDAGVLTEDGEREGDLGGAGGGEDAGGDYGALLLAVEGGLEACEGSGGVVVDEVGAEG